MKNIAFSGKMCSGKTTLASYLVGRYNYKKVFFAKGVYQVAEEIFGMKGKDRELLQKVGTMMREIQEDVWVKYLLREVKLLSSFPDKRIFVLDDCRFVNEAIALQNTGWVLIRLECPKRQRFDRIAKLYPNTPLEAHIHISETALDKYEYFDYIIDAGRSLNEVISDLDLIIQKYDGDRNEKMCNVSEKKG